MAGGRLSLDRSARTDLGAVFDFKGGGCVTVGTASHIHRGAMLLTYGGNIHIGARCSINPYCVLYGTGGLTIGDDVRIAAHTVIVASKHNYADAERTVKDQGTAALGVTIGNDVWVGANATILDGARISTGCVIGAGAVILGETEPYGVYAGVPAKLVKHRQRITANVT